MRTDKRAVGIIIKDNKVLVFRRFKYGEWYFAFPGGGIESEETAEEAIVREMKEELCIDVKIDRFLFTVSIEMDANTLFKIESGADRTGYSKDQLFYLITDFIGVPELGGPEKARSCEANQYLLEWIPLSKIEETEKLYPEEGKAELVKLIKTNKL